MGMRKGQHQPTTESTESWWCGHSRAEHGAYARAEIGVPRAVFVVAPCVWCDDWYGAVHKRLYSDRMCILNKLYLTILFCDVVDCIRLCANIQYNRIQPNELNPIQYNQDELRCTGMY